MDSIWFSINISIIKVYLKHQYISINVCLNTMNMNNIQTKIIGYISRNFANPNWESTIIKPVEIINYIKNHLSTKKAPGYDLITALLKELPVRLLWNWRPSSTQQYSLDISQYSRRLLKLKWLSNHLKTKIHTDLFADYISKLCQNLSKANFVSSVWIA